MKSCEKHPKYKGKKKPKYICEKCLQIYLELHKIPRAPRIATKVFKDKKKYIRKKKHEISEY